MAETEPAPLITDTMRATVGVRGEPIVCEVDKLQIRLFARAVGHTDPIYYDEDEAKKAGYRSLPCPPGYLGTPVFDPRTHEFGSGRAPGMRAEPETTRPLTRILNAGTEIEYFDDIVAGDVLTSVSYVSDFQERKGGLGEMLITTTKTEYTNATGKVVAISTGNLIRY